MSEIDRVFPKLDSKKSPGSESRSHISVPRKGAATGARVVEVVRVRSGRSQAKDPPQRQAFGVHAATWPEGFPARAETQVLPVMAAPEVEPPKRVVPDLPMWTAPHPEVQPELPDTELASVEADEPKAAGPAVRASRESTRRVADPFAAGDEGANCLRCGYAIEPARERRGLMTCATCG